MDETARINVLQLKVAELERKLDFVMRHLRVEYKEAPLPPALHEAATLLAQGNKLGAIQVYQRLTGQGLKEAKEAVDALEARLRGT